MEENPVECNFCLENDKPTPYIRTLFSYDINEKHGTIEYNGYFYIEDNKFPSEYMMCINKREDMPYKIEGNTRYYKHAMSYLYKIRIYRRVVIENTNVYSGEEDNMRVCFFQTNRERLYFDVIEAVDMLVDE